MEAVYPLVTIPKPLDPEKGKSQVSVVSAFTKSRKRKRFEVCAAVDGDSLNIYNVESSSLLISHSVSPQTKFLCPPCAVYIKSKTDKSEIRRIYAPIRDTTTNNTLILSYDDKKTGGGPSALNRSQKQIAIIDDILAFEPVKTSFSATKDDSTFELLLISKNGSVECYSSDLEQRIWQTNLGRSLPEHVSIIDAKFVIDGLLESRQDLASHIRALANNNVNHLKSLPLIVSIWRSPMDQSLHISLYAIPSRTDSFGGLRQSLQDIGTLKALDLPLESLRQPGLNYSWNLKAGLLHVSSSSTILTLDFADSTPKVLSSFNPPSGQVISSIAAPGNLLLSLSSSSISLYDTKYSSIQDRQPMSSQTSGSARKRKRVLETALDNSTILVEYFSRLGFAIALRGHDLLAIQLSADIRTKNLKHSMSKLSDSLGKGLEAINRSSNGQELTNGDLTHSTSKDDWPSRRDDLVKLLEEGDIDAFDRQFAFKVGLKPSQSSENEVSTQWNWTESVLSKGAIKYRPQALFALRTIFKLGDPEIPEEEAPRFGEESNLRIRALPPVTFQWLVRTGQLTPKLIEQAIRTSPAHPSIFSVSSTDLITSIIEFDPSLEVLCYIIALNPRFELEDTMQAMKHLIRSLDTSTLPAPTTLLSVDDENFPDADTDDALELEVEKALGFVDMALNDIEDGHPMRADAMRRLIAQLTGFSPSSISLAMRKALSQHEIVYLIHLLRIELAAGGWTSRYVDAAASQGDEETVNHSITITSRLIGCAVDAMGVTGWLTTSATDPVDSVDELLSSLRAETSAALEGIHEATYMNGLLGEFLLYSSRVAQSSGLRNPENTSVYKSNLPLGLKVDDLSLYKVQNNGDRIRRSKRDIARQISMKLPAYKVEKIRV